MVVGVGVGVVVVVVVVVIVGKSCNPVGRCLQEKASQFPRAAPRVNRFGQAVGVDLGRSSQGVEKEWALTGSGGGHIAGVRLQGGHGAGLLRHGQGHSAGRTRTIASGRPRQHGGGGGKPVKNNY